MPRTACATNVRIAGLGTGMAYLDLSNPKAPTPLALEARNSVHPCRSIADEKPSPTPSPGGTRSWLRRSPVRVAHSGWAGPGFRSHVTAVSTGGGTTAEKSRSSAPPACCTWRSSRQLDRCSALPSPRSSSGCRPRRLSPPSRLRITHTRRAQGPRRPGWSHGCARIESKPGPAKSVRRA